MRASSSYKLIFLGTVTTILVIVAHGFLPEKRMRIYPGETGGGIIYADEASGGLSRATWVDEEKMHWRCDVRESATHRFCGFHIDFAHGQPVGLDLSQYKAVRVKLHVETSDSRMRIYFRNFEEGFSDEGNIETAKFNNVLIPTSELKDELTLNLDEFSVAEWWINERNVPRQFAAPNFNNVRTIGIDLGVPPGVGIHEMRLEKLEFMGEWISAERWYRGILFGWVGIIVLLGLTRYIQINRRLVREREMLDQLASHNSVLKDEHEKYRELSSLDKLTGALNRHGFDQLMTELRAHLSPNDELALLVLDLDHFKEVNDKRGHDVGDKVLKCTADIVSSNIRHSDNLARWGGEEFVVLCPIINEQGALALAEKLRAVVASMEIPIQPPVKVTTSVGVGCFKMAEDFEEVFKRVDEALYRAKNGGRNRVAKAER